VNYSGLSLGLGNWDKIATLSPFLGNLVGNSFCIELEMPTLLLEWRIDDRVGNSAILHGLEPGIEECYVPSSQ
jgi:hypothetical protein